MRNKKRGKFLVEVIVAAGLLALATVGFFWQILLTPNAWTPAGGGDLAPFLYPTYRFAAEHLRQGIIPLWNPHLYSGTPFAADIQSGLFYPVNLLVFLFVPNLTYQWLEYLAVFHLWLAGVTMYLCLRLLIPTQQAEDNSPSPRPIVPLAAFAGAIAFQFSDLFIVHFGNLNLIAVAAWLPLIFLLFHHSLVKSSYGLAAAGGAVLAIATLAGHIQITLFILLTLGLYALWYFGFRMHGSGVTLALFRPLLLLLVTLLVTIGLSALLLLPAYQLSQYTPRAELPYAEATRYSLHPAQLVGLLVPNYFGRDPAMHWGPWERVETGYIGIITLMLAPVGALLYPGRIKGFFVGLGIIALLLALGGYSLLHGWLYALVPGFDQLRAPARFILLLDFSLAALAACGLNQLLQPLNEKAKNTFRKLLTVLTWSLGGLIVIAAPLGYYAMLVTQDRNPTIFNRAVGAAGGVAMFAFFTIAALISLHLIHSHQLREKWAGFAVIGLLLLDLFTLGANVDTGHHNPTAAFDHPEALAFLRADPGLYRIEVTTDVWHLWQPNTALLAGLYDVWGLYNPLVLADTKLYWEGAPPRHTSRYNFLGVKYIIASKAGAPADSNIIPVFDGDPGINIYLNQDSLPRVLFVGQTRVVANHDAAWEAIRADTFDPVTTVILEGGQTLNFQPASALSIFQYHLHTVTIGVNTNQPGYLVLSEAFYPGWQATVDSQPTPIERANYAFRAVYVPAGQHTVQFVFKPVIWKVGLILSGLTLLVLAGWAGWEHWTRAPKVSLIF
ncbi:MAG: YfhO family protein [Anaerolineae bacterium]|nr:YfhO family protein [Anaerolineae bacterium]